MSLVKINSIYYSFHRLVKWCIKEGKSQRIILEESPLTELVAGMNIEQGTRNIEIEK